MEVLISKASDDNWWECRKFDSLQNLFDYIESCGHSIVLEESYFYNLDVEWIMKAYQVTEEEAEKIQNIKWNALIYDTYIE